MFAAGCECGCAEVAESAAAEKGCPFAGGLAADAAGAAGQLLLQLLLD